MADYNDAFYAERDQQTRASAAAILGIVEQLTGFRSLIDVGCGVGTWLAVAQQRGVADVFGVEGEWVDPAKVVIDRSNFLNADLRKPLPVQRTFDVAMSLEVAEHLPESVADDFVATLTRLAPVVLFSGAVPRQRGVGHINEQWPDYWARKFLARDYVALDVIRPRVWDDEKVLWWYSQNAMLAVRRDRLDSDPKLRDLPRNPPEPKVHPTNYLEMFYLLDDCRGQVRRHEGQRASLKHNFNDVAASAKRWFGRKLGKKG
jgi:SAM-dependent methyltransferase